MNTKFSFGLIVICILIATVAGIMSNNSSNNTINTVNQSIKNSNSTNVFSSSITPITLSQGSSYKTANNNNFTANNMSPTIIAINNNTITVKTEKTLRPKEKLTNNELAQTIADLK